jgi:hypothetical protein
MKIVLLIVTIQLYQVSTKKQYFYGKLRNFSRVFDSLKMKKSPKALI